MRKVKKIFVPLEEGANIAGIAESCLDIATLFPHSVLIKPKAIPESQPNLKNIGTILEVSNDLAKCVEKEIEKGNATLVIGGDHAVALGSISGVANHFANLGLIWIDAHGDMNTHETTETGNIHGMILASLQGFGEKRLKSILNPSTKILKNNIVIFGVRDLDIREKQLMDEEGIKYISFSSIKNKGFRKSLETAKESLSQCEYLHISFDLDSCDPDNVPGVSVPVKGGFQQDDIFAILNFLFKAFKVVSADIVEYNMLFDEKDMTRSFLLKLIDYFTISLSKTNL